MYATVDMKKFRGYLRTKLQTTSLRDASKELSVLPFGEVTSLSASSISRIATGDRTPELQEFFLLCGWLGVHYSEFISDPERNVKQMPTPMLIESILRSDKNIPEQAAAAISQLVKIAYNLTSTNEE